MTNLPVVQQELPLEKLGAIFFKSGMFQDIKSEAQAVVKILAGRELGLPPIYSMTKIAIVKGRVTVGAEAIAALVKRDSRYNYQVTDHTSERCTIDFYEDGHKAYTSTFTIADAKGAGLVKQDSAWQTYPRAMLFSRAISQGARIVCPHLISGVYTHEEMGLEVTEEGEPLSVPVAEPSQEFDPDGARERVAQKRAERVAARATRIWAQPEGQQGSAQGQEHSLKPKADISTHLMDYRPYEAMRDIREHLDAIPDTEEGRQGAKLSDEASQSVRSFLGDRVGELRRPLNLPLTDKDTYTRRAMSALAIWLAASRELHGDEAVLAAVDGIITAHLRPKEEELFPEEVAL